MMLQITIIEYASFTCPHCASFHKNVFPSLRKNYIETGKVKFIYREVYFDGPGLWAALLARCGGAKKYFGISDLLYSKQREWTKGDGGAAIAQNLYKIGRIAGLDQSKMEVMFARQRRSYSYGCSFPGNYKSGQCKLHAITYFKRQKYRQYVLH